MLSDTVHVKTALSKETSPKAQNLSKIILTSAIVLVGKLSVLLWNSWSYFAIFSAVILIVLQYIGTEI